MISRGRIQSTAFLPHGHSLVNQFNLLVPLRIPSLAPVVEFIASSTDHLLNCTGSDRIDQRFPPGRLP